jgi:hypothetical protein
MSSNTTGNNSYLPTCTVILRLHGSATTPQTDLNSLYSSFPVKNLTENNVPPGLLQFIHFGFNFLNSFFFFLRT